MEQTNRKHHRSQLTQIPIYLGKFFRMFLYLDDWKLLPMGALIAALVAFVVRKRLFINQEGIIVGALAVSCVCVWNGGFNSIQVVCRERGIIKREHRAGMFITSYVLSHMIYQAFLCILQTFVTLGVFSASGMKFPTEGFITPYFHLDFGITIFLITYAADILSLVVSCIARTTTAAMTIMPLLLIFQLVFSGGMFQIPARIDFLKNLSLMYWGVNAISRQADFNELPNEVGWGLIQKFENLEEVQQLDPEEKLVIDMLLKDPNSKEKVTTLCSKANHRDEFEKTVDGVKNCWFYLQIFIFVEALAAMLLLKRIDNDKR